jgi:tRNA G18 (ribose-2'-O)-methylase SpoU
VILHIESAADPRLEPYRHVGDDQWLRQRGLFVAEGRLVLERLIFASSHSVQSVLLSPTAHAALEPVLLSLNAPVYVASQTLLNETTGYNFHRGCIGLGSRPAPRSFESVAVNATLLLGMEQIGNPDNVGGLFRTAAAFGVHGILVDARSSDPYYRKAIRTSMGTVLDMPFATIEDWPTTIHSLRDRGFETIALTPSPTAVDLDGFYARDHTASVIILVGAEGSGLSDDVLTTDVTQVRIPMAHGVDSLNVVVAAGVALSRLRPRT